MVSVPSNGTRRKLTGKDAGVVTILNSRDRVHTGMGVAIGPRYILTCAHVVNQALNYPDESTTKPKDHLRLFFPLLEGMREKQAIVNTWVPSGLDGRGDLALLSLLQEESDLPTELGFVTFVNVMGRSLDHDLLCIYGLSAEETVGTHVDLHFVGTARGSLVQVNSIDSKNVISRGFSGGAIFDVREQAAIGILLARKYLPVPGEPGASASKAAFVQPSREIASQIPTVRIEVRNRPGYFNTLWNCCAAIVFLLSILLLVASQEFPFVPVHAQLVAFFGMHILSGFGVLISWLFFCYSKDFYLSHWSLRLPAFPFLKTNNLKDRRPAMAIFCIFAFAIVPLLTQWHLLEKFHQEGQVFAKVKKFGFECPNSAAVNEEWCLNEDFCQKIDAGRYSVSSSVSKKGSSWNHAYQYGEVKEHRSKGLGEQSSSCPEVSISKLQQRSAVTFFPIVQPIFVLCLTFIWIFLVYLSLHNVLRGRILRPPA
jgi:hypothetical protein